MSGPLPLQVRQRQKLPNAESSLIIYDNVIAGTGRTIVNPLGTQLRRWFGWLLLAPGLAVAAPFAYIPNGGSNNVSVIDTASNTVVSTIAVGSGPIGVAVNATGTRVYVSNLVSNSVSVIDTATNAASATVPVGASPGGIAVNPAGTRVYVANLDAGSVSVIDTGTNAVTATVTVGASPGGVAVNPAGTRVYVPNSDGSTISVIDAATNAVIASVTVGASPQAVALNSAGTRMYATIDSTSSVSIIDTATNSVVGSVAVGATPAGVAVNPAGTRAYAASCGTNRVTVIDTTANTAVATVNVGACPGGLAVNPAGTRVYVANSDSNNVSVIDTATNTVVATIPVGSIPVALGQFIGPDAAPTTGNYQGLWWNAAESGWGVNFAHQGDRIFATWYTYDTSGNAYWLSMLAGRTSPTSGTYTGDVYVDVGPPFSNFTGSGTPTKVGTGSLTFSDVNNGSFSYSVTAGGATGVSQTKAITRFDLGSAPQPVCQYSAKPRFSLATNFQDLWWVSSESGWGVNFAHQGDLLFATWYTYDQKNLGSNNPPLWLSALLTRQGSGDVFSGPITRTAGPRFDNYKETDRAPVQTVGTATATFANGNSATFSYGMNGVTGLPTVSQTKTISRFLFAGTAGTVCH